MKKLKNDPNITEVASNGRIKNDFDFSSNGSNCLPPINTDRVIKHNRNVSPFSNDILNLHSLSIIDIA